MGNRVAVERTMADAVEAATGPLWQILPLLLAIMAATLALRLLLRRVRPGRRPGSGLAAIEAPAVALAPRPVWTGVERAWFTRLRKILDEPALAGGGLIVFSQVSMGEALAVTGPHAARTAAFNAINAKRFDFLIVSADGTPRLAVEIHGAGHYGGDARDRDRIKRAACGRAGLPIVEIDHREDADRAADRIRAALGPRQTVADRGEPRAPDWPRPHGPGPVA